MHSTSRDAMTARSTRRDKRAINAEPAARPDRVERLERRRHLLAAARHMLAQCEQGRLTGLGSDTTALRELVAGLERLVAAGDATAQRVKGRSGSA
jgi:hypothetical protein